VFTPQKAGGLGASKVERWGRMAMDYQGAGEDSPPRIVHVVVPPDPGERESPHVVLERALRRLPMREPYDLGDAAFWAWFTLRDRPAITPLGQGFARGRFLAPQNPVRPRSAAPALPPPASWNGRIPRLPSPESGTGTPGTHGTRRPAVPTGMRL
jgi:hypothetical protein